MLKKEIFNIDNMLLKRIKNTLDLYFKNNDLLDTREFKNILEGVPLNNPEVSEYIRQFLNENSHEVDGGAVV